MNEPAARKKMPKSFMDSKRRFLLANQKHSKVLEKKMIERNEYNDMLKSLK